MTNAGLLITGHYIRALAGYAATAVRPPKYAGGLAVCRCTLSLAYIAQGFIADQLFGEADGAPRSLLAIGVQFSLVALVY